MHLHKFHKTPLYFIVGSALRHCRKKRIQGPHLKASAAQAKKTFSLNQKLQGVTGRCYYDSWHCWLYPTTDVGQISRSSWLNKVPWKLRLQIIGSEIHFFLCSPYRYFFSRLQMPEMYSRCILRAPFFKILPLYCDLWLLKRWWDKTKEWRWKFGTWPRCASSHRKIQ